MQDSEDQGLLLEAIGPQTAVEPTSSSQVGEPQLPVAAPAPGTSEVSMKCRICQKGDEVLFSKSGELIIPCCCKGNRLLVHRHCIQERTKSTRNKFCEFCGFRFRGQLKLLPSTLVRAIFIFFSINSIRAHMYLRRHSPYFGHTVTSCKVGVSVVTSVSGLTKDSLSLDR